MPFSNMIVKMQVVKKKEVEHNSKAGHTTNEERVLLTSWQVQTIDIEVAEILPFKRKYF